MTKNPENNNMGIVVTGPRNAAAYVKNFFNYYLIFKLKEILITHLNIHGSSNDKSETLSHQTGHDAHGQKHEETHRIMRLIRHEVDDNNINRRKNEL